MYLRMESTIAVADKHDAMERILNARAKHSHAVIFPPPTRVTPRIWLGSREDAMNVEFLTENRITHVVNCAQSLAGFVSRVVPEASIKSHIVLDAHDDERYPILERHLDAVTQFMDTVLADPESTVLIHCMAGINRSATLVLAYVAQKQTMDGTMDSGKTLLERFADVFESVMEVRPIILMNRGFFYSLIRWAQMDIPHVPLVSFTLVE